MTTKETVLEGAEFKSEDVTLRNGQRISVSEMSGASRDAIEASWSNGGRDEFRARLIIACARGSDGELLFTGSDFDAIRAAPAGYFEPIVDKALDINGYTSSEREALEGN